MAPIHLCSHDKVVELAEICRLRYSKWGGRWESFWDMGRSLFLVIYDYKEVGNLNPLAIVSKNWAVFFEKKLKNSISKKLIIMAMPSFQIYQLEFSSSYRLKDIND